MTLKLEERYPLNSTPESAEYPGGSFKDDTTKETKDGTPLQKDWQDDMLGSRDSILEASGLVKNGEIETALVSQFRTGVQKLLSTQPPKTSIEELCSGVNSKPWVDTDGVNKLDLGGLGISSACIGWDFDTETPCLYVSTTGGTSAIYKISGNWEYGENMDFPEGEPLALDFPSTPYNIGSVCCDGEYIYVHWGLSGGSTYVTKFSARTLSALWTCDIETNYGASFSLARLIIANTNTVALTFYGTISESFPFGWGCAMIAKSNGAKSKGVGHADFWNTFVFNTSDTRLVKAVSDGTHVYRIAKQGGSSSSRLFYLQSFKISDPTTSDHDPVDLGSWVNAETWTHPAGLAYANGRVVVGSADGQVSLYSTSSKLYIPGFRVSPLLGEIYPDEQDCLLGFDGVNVWGLYVLRYDSGYFVQAVLKIPCGSLSKTRLILTLQEQSFSGVTIENEEPITAFTQGHLLHDGLNMLAISNTGNIYRVCKPGDR